ncbi:hypothetical protein CDL15_Pgr008458 [Punica granatum]|uniref:Uncharacterized protein n=1 Tax=Punica granatum TaxID=22663 RepID=A0A218WMR3_PUNGR|nr:hypothetical protein CDL15_Pgr008458 [Punica granatum]
MKIGRELGSGPSIGDPDPSTELTGAQEDADDLDGGAGVADWQPPSRIDRGPPSRSSRSIRGRGLQLATPTPPSRSPVPTEVAGD